ncbi:hypothetical protein Taro_048853 [Colocasia esculenta]|uniref:Uncharacterized protein n=1 Tax=Colocasia esculenta TaxID=4460 RepID=A0A843X9A6_COLES|nr:hypothetical protein [Colocasia esculenta]
MEVAEASSRMGVLHLEEVAPPSNPAQVHQSQRGCSSSTTRRRSRSRGPVEVASAPKTWESLFSAPSSGESTHVLSLISLVAKDHKIAMCEVEDLQELHGAWDRTIVGCLTCSRGAAVGPFVRDCEAERLFLCCVVRVFRGQSKVRLLPLGRLRSRKTKNPSLHPLEKKATTAVSRSRRRRCLRHVHIKA